MPNLIQAPNRVYNVQEFCFYDRSWIYCREELLYNFRNKQIKYLFYYGDRKGNVERFLKDFQKKAKIPVKWRCNVLKTDDKEIVAIKLNSFWRSLYRFSLLTALIRIGEEYKNSLNSSINKYEHCSYGNGKNAILRFMDGYWNIRHYNFDYDDYYSLRFDGWFEYFWNTNADYKRVLYKRKRKK